MNQLAEEEKNIFFIKSIAGEKREELLFWVSCYVYLIVALIWRMRFSSLIDASWFVESARGLLDGSFEVYRGKDGHLPLFAVTIAPFVFLADKSSIIRAENLIGIVPIGFDVLCVYQFRLFLNREAVALTRETKLFLCLILLFNPMVFNGSAEMGHPESMMTFFILLGLRHRDRPLRSGVYFGLAQLAEHVALFAIVPFFLYLVSNKKSGDICKFAFSSTGIFALIFLPLFLIDPSGTLYKVLDRQINLQLIGVNAWTVMNSLVGEHHGLERFEVVYSSFLMLIMAIILSVFNFFVTKRRDIYGVILVSMSLQLLFAKSVAPYHVIRTVFLLFFWDMFRRKMTLPYAALAFTVILSMLRSLQPYQYVQLLHFLLYVVLVVYVLFNLRQIKATTQEEVTVRSAVTVA